MTLADYEKDPNHITNDFIKYYYSKLSSGCSKLYQLYTPDAVLKHINHTSDPFKAVSADYHDIENIKKYWKSFPSLSGAKLVILTVNTIQNSDSSLVTNVVGELLLKEDYENDDEILPTRLFTQTFILQPHPSKDIYDIKSDILTFIPDTDHMKVELNGNSVQAEEQIESVNGVKTPNEEEEVQFKEQVQQEVVEPPTTSRLNGKSNSIANGLNSDNGKKIVKNNTPSSSSSTSSSLTNNTTTDQKRSSPASQPATLSSSSSSELASASTVATSANTASARPTETIKPNGTVSTAAISSEPGKKDLSNNHLKPSTQNTPQPTGGAEHKHGSASTASRNAPASASSNTSVPSTAAKSDKISPETSASPKLHSASPTPSSTPAVKQKAASASQETKPTPVSQPAPSASSTWASALKSTNKPASPLLSQSQTAAQQSHSQSSPKSGSAHLNASSASSSAIAPANSNSSSSNNNSNQFNRQQLYEVYVNFKNSATPVDETDLKSAFSSNKFKHFTIVTVNKNNTAIVGFNSQEEQARALALGKIVQGETQFGIDKREKKVNGKKRSNTYKNSSKRN